MLVGGYEVYRKAGEGGWGTPFRGVLGPSGPPLPDDRRQPGGSYMGYLGLAARLAVVGSDLEAGRSVWSERRQPRQANCQTLLDLPASRPDPTTFSRASPAQRLEDKIIYRDTHHITSTTQLASLQAASGRSADRSQGTQGGWRPCPAYLTSLTTHIHRPDQHTDIN